MFTIGKTLYKDWARNKRKKRVSSIYKKTPIISVSIVYIVKTLQSGQDIKEKKGSYIYKEKHLYRNALYIRNTVYETI